MARRNHSRRAHAPYGYGYPGIGYAEETGGRPESEGGRRAEGSDEMGRWGGVPQFVSDRPHTSLMTAFGVGFGLGLLVTLLLNREEESWFDRYAPDAIQDLPDRLHHVRHKLSDTMSGSLEQARHRLSDSMSGPLKHAGETLASYVPRSWKPW